MGYLLFELAIIDGFLAYKTQSVCMGFLSGFMFGMGIGHVVIRQYQAFIEEITK